MNRRYAITRIKEHCLRELLPSDTSRERLAQIREAIDFAGDTASAEPSALPRFARLARQFCAIPRRVAVTILDASSHPEDPLWIHATAIDCFDAHREAETLIAIIVSGDPRGTVRPETRDLIDQLALATNPATRSCHLYYL